MSLVQPELPPLRICREGASRCRDPRRTRPSEINIDLPCRWLAIVRRRLDWTVMRSTLCGNIATLEGVECSSFCPSDQAPISHVLRYSVHVRLGSASCLVIADTRLTALTSQKSCIQSRHLQCTRAVWPFLHVSVRHSCRPARDSHSIA